LVRQDLRAFQVPRHGHCLQVTGFLYGQVALVESAPADA